MRALLRAIAGFRSVRVPDPEGLLRLDGVDAVVLVGPSCAGKTTLAGAIRECGAIVNVPPRYVTRPRRRDDRDHENLHVSQAEFEALVRAGGIGLRWIRPMEGDRMERYGFPPAAQDVLPVYSANNAIYSNPASVRPAGFLCRAILVGVHAPDDLRGRRLRRRSPELSPAESAFRLADTSESMRPHVHLVIDNHGAHEAIAPDEARLLVEAIVSCRRSVAP